MESIGSNKEGISCVHHCQLQGISPWFGETPQPFSKINADFNDKLLHSYSGWTDRLNLLLLQCFSQATVSQPGLAGGLFAI